MLKLNGIYKSYNINGVKQEVLKDINISFRKKEFVSILGDSGSGKTTLLNILGGLDIFDSGDLLICNKSTKDFSDRNWDSYRNHKIGFVFQSYNLIEHLSIYENIKLSLIFSSKSKKDIDADVMNALKKVGLENHANKLPNQLSGGEQQRIAIARAIVNNPDIILADEPTGALDSKTSIEIMNIFKDISKDKLVIMVTHNIDLANKYSSRIIKIKDGKVLNDSNPYDDNSLDSIERLEKNRSLGFVNTFFISVKNLLTKKKRTILTSIACSVGITGIALVLAISNGVNKYIKKVEASSMSEYPIIIERKSYDYFGTVNNLKVNCKKNRVCISDDNNSSIIKNNIKDFKRYIDINNKFNKYIVSIASSYDIDLNVYANNYTKVDKDLFKEIENDDGMLLYGRLPKEFNEIIIVTDKNGYISKRLLNSLNMDKSHKKNYSYNEIMNGSFKLVLNTDYYKEENGNYIDYSYDNEYIKSIVDNGLELNVVGLLKSSSDNESYIGYVDKLTNYLIDNISKTDLYNKQLIDKTKNIITNTNFDESTNTYEDMEKNLGIYELNNPSKIKIYAKDYKSKKKIIKLIDEYNDKQSKFDKIKYTDMMQSLVDLISKILNVISFVLIGFASISLIVSGIMISIITYISVVERTKEIGILRSIGASKKDVVRLFNMETLIEGLLSGFIAIVTTMFLAIIINLIVRSIIDIKNICHLSFGNILFLIVLSIGLNLLSGLKSSFKASKTNPVDALKCE